MKILLALLLCSLPSFAAANITLGSLALNADGITYTGTTSAAIVTSSSLGPCFTLAGGSVVSDVIASASSNGTTTVTILGTAAAPIYKTDTPTITVVTSGCPAVDGSGNTFATGQTNLAVTNGTEWRAGGDATMQADCRYNAAPVIGTDGNGYPNAVQWNMPGSSMECHATGTAVQIIAFNYTNTWSIFQDGVPQQCPGNCASQNVTDFNCGIFTTSCSSLSNFVTATSAGAVYSNVSLATSLTGSHLYRITSIFGQPKAGGNGSMIIAAVRFVGGGVTGTKPVGTLPIIEAIGESNTGTGGGAPVDNSQYDPGILSMYTSMGVTELYAAGSGDVVATVKEFPSLFVPLSVTPCCGLVSEGANDAVDGTSIPSYTADFEIMLCNMMNLTACGDGHYNTKPPTYLFVRGLPNTLGGLATPYNAAMRVAVNAVNAAQGTSILYFPSVSWINQSPLDCPTNDISNDSDHFCGTNSLTGPGFGKLANREVPILNPYVNGGASFTISGSTTVSGVASLTLTLPISATWQDQVTVTSSNSNDTMCFGSICGKGSVTLPAGFGINAAVLTMTGTAGTRTMSYGSLAPLWTAPSNTSVTLTVGAPTLILLGKKE